MVPFKRFEMMSAPTRDWHDGNVQPDQVDDLAGFLAEFAPFDALDPAALREVAGAARVRTYSPGAQIIDAFTEPTRELFVVLDGRVELWGSVESVPDAPDETLTRGGVFGFSAMLTQRSIGPRAIAGADGARTARLPASAVRPAFSSTAGVRFLAEQLSGAPTAPASTAYPSYGVVDELIVNTPILVSADTAVGEVARQMTERGLPYAAVQLADGEFGLVTDAVLREQVIVAGRSSDTAVAQILDRPALTTRVGESAAEALITMLDRQADFMLVLERTGELRGAVAPTDFVVSTTTAGVALRQQLTRAGSVEDLVDRAHRVPTMLDDLLARGLATNKVIAVYSATVDAVIRRALTLVFDRHPELDIDRFTWLSLGSNGRREAVLSSDVDSAVAFDPALGEDVLMSYRAAFAEVNDVVDRAGISVDEHGATAARPPFSRTNDQWRSAARDWLADPVANKGAIMTSLLVDGRPIHGDPGLPAVSKVFSGLRRHPGTMRLLLEESLSQRAKVRSMRDVMSRRGGTFDIKAHALVPIVNIARWAALSVGAAELPTVDRLGAAAGSQMLRDDAAATLSEVFVVLQRLRLRYQLLAHERGAKPSDVLTMARLSPIDRSVVAQAVREVAAVQKRMENLSHFVPSDEWTDPARD